MNLSIKKPLRLTFIDCIHYRYSHASENSWIWIGDAVFIHPLRSWPEMFFEIKQGNESLTSHSDLSLVGALLQKTYLQERLNKVVLPDHPRPEISHGMIATSMIGLLCLGKPDFEAIEAFRGDEFFRRSLGLDTIPSEGSLRQRLNNVHGAFDWILKEDVNPKTPSN